MCIRDRVERVKNNLGWRNERSRADSKTSRQSLGFGTGSQELETCSRKKSRSVQGLALPDKMNEFYNLNQNNGLHVCSVVTLRTQISVSNSQRYLSAQNDDS